MRARTACALVLELSLRIFTPACVWRDSIALACLEFARQTSHPWVIFGRTRASHSRLLARGGSLLLLRTLRTLHVAFFALAVVWLMCSVQVMSELNQIPRYLYLRTSLRLVP